MLKKFFITFIVIIFLLLDFTALDDITTGNEPSLFGEYLIVFLTFPVFGYLLGNFWLYLAHTFKKKVTRFTHFKGFHFHHSSLGLLMLLTAFFIFPPWFKITVAGLGVGIFIHHIVTDDLVFITRD